MPKPQVCAALPSLEMGSGRPFSSEAFEADKKIAALPSLEMGSGRSAPFSSEAFESDKQMFHVLRATFSSVLVHEQLVSTSVVLRKFESAEDVARQTAEMLAALEPPTDPKVNNEVDALIARTAERNNRRRPIIRKR